MKRTIALLSAVLLATAILPATNAQPYVPTPGTNDLGISDNDVREEPSAPDDDNGFPDDPEGPFFSPKDDALILDAYVTYGELAGEDISNIQNRVQHGNNYEEHERKMYPGPNYFAAWWGWWSDTGGGGDLQQNPDTADAVDTSANGAIDDADDCGDAEWDEFVWRSGNDHPCPEDHGLEDVEDDTLFAFIQPGTHNIHVNSIPAPTLGPFIPPSPIHNDTDSSQVPDFRYDCGGQGCGSPNGFARYQYDQSLLMTTQVVSAVNPLETDSGDAQSTYDPYTKGTDASVHMVDQDFYTALDPAVEDVYRTAVWNPERDYSEGDSENVLAPVHEGGLKQFIKEDGNAALVQTSGEAQATASSIVQSFAPQAGLAYDAMFGPRPHEPNTAGDQYGVDTEGNEVNWATFDEDTSYDPTTDSDGDGEEEYYEPGEDQTYTGYQTEEHTWLDTTTAMDVCPIFAGITCYHEWAHYGANAPSSSDPVGDLSDKGDSQSVGPGILYVHSNLGTWHDANGDTWVGDVNERSVQVPGRHGPGLLGTDESQPYYNGLIQDPNQYDSDEFRPVCEAEIDVTLRSNLDSDGDGLGEWGTTGVYVFPYAGLPYTNMYMDVVGNDADPVLTPLRDEDNVGGTVSAVAPEDEDGRLSEYRVEGPINMTMVPVGTTCDATGSWDPGKRVVFPTGNPGYSITVTTQAETTEPQVANSGENDGQSLTGEQVVDVDIIHANQDEIEGTPVFDDHPLGNNPGS